MSAVADLWTPLSALEQLERCAFECEAGPLENSVAFRWLKEAAKDGPEFWPGQSVWLQIEAEAAGKKLQQWVRFFIVGCAMDSNEERRFWTYSLSYDPPAPWHYGKVHFQGIRADRLRLVDPVLQAIEEEERQREASDNGQFGVGA